MVGELFWEPFCGCPDATSTDLDIGADISSAVHKRVFRVLLLDQRDSISGDEDANV